MYSNDKFPEEIIPGPHVEAHTLAFLQALNAVSTPELFDLSLAEARATISAEQTTFDLNQLPAVVEEVNIHVPDAHSITVHIIRPDKNVGALPIVMYFHGGGWVLGDIATHERLARQIAIGAEVAVVLVNYSRSPEFIYPTALQEAYEATMWMAENGKVLHLDTTRIAVAGDSSGGNLATGVTLLAKQKGGPKLLLQLLFFPTLDHNFDTLSYRQYANGYFLTRAQMQWFWDEYVGTGVIRNEITVSPLRATTEDLKGLPSALIITAEHDVLRDEGEAYARNLMTAGVTVTATRYLGTIHAFMFLNNLWQTPAAKAAIAQANEKIREVFDI
ncbi:acetyl esterase [Chitinophaga niastensis]|uniref:Acetyl esterase n=1 Tax=Chitinophaga niastensis TaxID=536980 RepID=A0A2P8HNP2_CHINA|nr:alpha/beta hydrolase [Chitinophaga niastensis]PSL47832.1 acetyl esterase [Chitinophaga niastensis]